MALIDDIKERVDIVAVVGDYLPLQKAGRNFKASCPFHTERTPSFYVFPERQTWRCFGACAAGGDVVTFVQRRENLDFVQTLRLLAQRANIPFPERPPPQSRGTTDPLLHANQVAAEFYHQSLSRPAGQEALAYLLHRGLDQATIQRFQLGYSPGGEALRQHLASLDVSATVAQEAGLLRLTDDNRLVDLFHRRIMFPIHDAQGRTTGFGGRVLGDGQPKYLNTPQTPLFDKGRTLYALHLAAPAIRQGGTGVIVEGYMDAIAAHQHGFTNVVAAMGTSLTAAQAERLRGLGHTFILALDADAAGQTATLRSLEGTWRVLERHAAFTSRTGVTLFQRTQGPELKILPLPPGQDPDQVIQAQPQTWERLVQQAAPWWEFYFQAEAARLDLSSPQGQEQLVQRLFPVIAERENPYLQERLFSRLAQLVGLSRSALEASVGRPRPAPRSRSAPPVPQVAASVLRAGHTDPLEDYTLALLLQHPVLRGECATLGPQHLRRAQNRELFTIWLSCSTLECLRSQLPALLVDHLDELLRYPLPESDDAQRAQGFRQVLRRLEERRLRELKLEEEETLQHQWTEERPAEEVIQQQDLSVTEALRQLHHSSQGPAQPR